MQNEHRNNAGEASMGETQTLPPSVDVSIVVTTFNRASALQTALASIGAQQTSDDISFEVVVVDNLSTDDTPATVREFARSTASSVRRVVEEQKGVCFARNRGIRESRGEWIAFFDDDQIAEPNWLQQLVDFAKSKNVLCVGGSRDLIISNEEDNDSPAITPYCRILLGECSPAGSTRPYNRRFLPTTGNSLIHRDVVRRVGEFDERCLEGGEDTLFFSRVLAAGHEMWFTPDALVHHVIPIHRISQQHFRSTSLRRGVIMGRRDFDESGRWGLGKGVCARSIHAGAVLLPSWLWRRATKDGQLAFDEYCRLKRFEGYLRFAMSRLAPRAFRQSGFFSTHQHRSAGRVAS